jgi:AAA+ superfamily predicted ATPase
LTLEELDELRHEASDHLKSGRYRMAFASAQKLYEEQPENYLSACCYAWALLENSEPNKALDVINLAVLRSNNSSDARLYRAYLLYRLSIFEGALSDINFILSENKFDNLWAIKIKTASLAGAQKYLEALEFIDDKLISSGDEELNQIRKWLEIILDQKKILNSNQLLGEADKAYRYKNYWFSIWAAEKVLNSSAENIFHKEAHLLQLESLLSSFQILKAINKYEELYDLYFDDEKFNNIFRKISSYKSSQKRSMHSAEVESAEFLSDLNEYIGLHELKNAVKDFIAYINFNKERKAAGLKTDEHFSINCIFLGNPGTGKTTVARILGKILNEIGMLKNGHVVEVDRAALVGQYVGETAQKTEAKIKEALGGVLFIDEAYSLKKDESQHDFGQESIDILLKRMEDNKGDLMVIAAGYPQEMKRFINSNPGLKSRFTHTFYFEDYSPQELLEILKQTAQKEDFQFSEEAFGLLKNEFENLYQKRDSSFGNARLVRNIFNSIKLEVSRRFLHKSETKLNKEALTFIQAADVDKVLSTFKRTYIDEKELKNAELKLDKLVGQNQFKNEMHDLIKLTCYFSETGKESEKKNQTNYLFAGKHGTGKTASAKLTGEIYSALGLLSKRGITEINERITQEIIEKNNRAYAKSIIEKSLGGVLLIKNAAVLSDISLNKEFYSNEFKRELIKILELESPDILVILADEKESLETLLNKNPELIKHFSNKIFFEEYSPDELLMIMKQLFASNGYYIEEDSGEIIEKYFRFLIQKDKYFDGIYAANRLADEIVKNHLLRIADIPPEERHEDAVKFITVDDVKISDKKLRFENADEDQRENSDNYIIRLNDLAGQDKMKKSAEKFLNSLRVADLRKLRGMKLIPKNINLTFIGNKGTGKKTTAKILSGIFKEMNVLPSDKFIEMDFSKLYLNDSQSSNKNLLDLIENSPGGTLYLKFNLIQQESTPLMSAAYFDELKNIMEKYSNKVCFILAGNEKEISQLFEVNPEIKSYFSNFFHFEDYNPRQMLEIAYQITSRHGYNLDEGAWQQLLDIFIKIYKERDNNFANADTVIKILYKIISSQEERILKLYNPSDHELSSIRFEDVERIQETVLR